MKICPFEPMAISVRAFVPCPKGGPDTEKRSHSSRAQRRSSEWTLTLDTETTVDAGQNLRFGAYQLRRGEELDEAGIFYDPAILTKTEQALLVRFAEKRGMKLYTREEFVEEVFFKRAYSFRASIVGFNLPFDLSRLAIRYGSARGKTMKGGFTFCLSLNRWWPHIQIKHISARNALIQFTKPPRHPDTRSEKRKKSERPPRRGAFVDVKTIAAALLSQSFSLQSLSQFLNIPHKKQPSEEHGGRLTEEYLAYCVTDVQATWECFRALSGKFENHRLNDTRLSQILSEASLGKAYLKEMGIRPFQEVQPDFPDAVTGVILSTYYGGRSEVRIRRVRTQVLYCDFLSMYPTVCTLMGLWKFVIAKGVKWEDSTAKTREFVESISFSDLQNPSTWAWLRTLVKVKPNADIFPVRARYDGEAQTIGLNFLSSENPLRYALADVIASKLLTGRSPEILEAITFEPLKAQNVLKAVAIAGNEKYKIDPVREDFFKRLIDLRAATKLEMNASAGSKREALRSQQSALKILANATSYGIFVEVNVVDLDRREQRTCFGPGGVGFSVGTDKSEEPGRYFYPLLATWITGAARLMLAITETLIVQSGLDWAFCDTDSMAIAKTAGTDKATFYSKATAICAWFEPLNPYKQKGSLLKIEDANYKLGTKRSERKFEPLYCYCISSKRYALFNLSDEGKLIIRKASAHGLGHLMAPYAEPDAPGSIPLPSLSLSEIGVARWQYDLWYQIICADLVGHRDQVDLTYHPALLNPAASRYGASTPEILRWFKLHNNGRPYVDQVKPFNFMICFQGRPVLTLDEADSIAIREKGPKPKARPLKPVAPFSKDIAEASKHAFDREMGKPVPVEALKTYQEALAQYHLSPESKFLDGDYLDSGRTERRHIEVTEIIHIGKEANRWEEQFFIGFEEERQIEYGLNSSDRFGDRFVRRMCKEFGEREAAGKLEISRMALRKALSSGLNSLRPSLQNRIARNGGSRDFKP